MLVYQTQCEEGLAGHGLTVKRAFKVLLRGASLIAVVPLWMLTKILLLFVKGDQPFQLASQLLSLAPGVPGNYLRGAFYWLMLARCGPDACIEFGTILHQQTIEIGRRVYVGPHCSIGECMIEDDVLLGSNVDIISGRHQHFFGRLDLPIREQGGRYEKIVIGADSWVGNSSVVMANIGCQSVVAAGSVVCHDVEPRSIVGGNPAVLIRKR